MTMLVYAHPVQTTMPQFHRLNLSWLLIQTTQGLTQHRGVVSYLTDAANVSQTTLHTLLMAIPPERTVTALRDVDIQRF
jgi:hypothetical protein